VDDGEKKSWPNKAHVFEMSIFFRMYKYRGSLESGNSGSLESGTRGSLESGTRGSLESGSRGNLKSRTDEALESRTCEIVWSDPRNSGVMNKSSEIRKKPMKDRFGRPDRGE
jgi:hypothetical protein